MSGLAELDVRLKCLFGFNAGGLYYTTSDLVLGLGRGYSARRIPPLSRRQALRQLNPGVVPLVSTVRKPHALSLPLRSPRSRVVLTLLEGAAGQPELIGQVFLHRDAHFYTYE